MRRDLDHFARTLSAAAALCLLGAGACGGGGASGNIGSPREDLPITPGRSVAYPLRGITTETVDSLTDLTDAVAHHRKAPTVRIVFQPDVSVSAYGPAIKALRPKAYLLGELVDSEAMASLSAAQIATRAEAYWSRYGDQIDIWEIGNELNGEWVGSSPSEINAKVQAAFDVIKTRHGGTTLLTLNYWSGPSCYSQPWEPTLLYAQGMPAALRNGIDYVALSVYETACDPRQEPTPDELASTLSTLATLFPNAKLAIGEVGAQRGDGIPEPSLTEKERIANRYYGMHRDLSTRVGSRFVGGYFWWYYAQDAIPRSAEGSLWMQLDELLSSL